MVCPHEPMTPGGQLAEEEPSKGQLHQLTLIQGLAQYAAQEPVVQVKVLVNQVGLQSERA